MKNTLESLSMFESTVEGTVERMVENTFYSTMESTVVNTVGTLSRTWLMFHNCFQEFFDWSQA